MRGIIKHFSVVFMLLALPGFMPNFATDSLASFVNINNVYFSNGVIPTEPLKFQQSGMEMRLLVIVKNPLLIDQPNNDGKPLELQESDQPRYLDPLMAYGQSADGEYYLVRTLTEGKQWGWIVKDYILAGYEPLRADQELGEKEEDAATPNPAFIKVVAKNNWRTASGRRIEAVPILNGPGSEFDTVAEVNIFRIRYAYDIRQGTDGKEYVLVGEEPSLNQYAANSGLSGWINREYAILWTSRVGVYYNRENLETRPEPVPIFKTLADLEEHMATGNSEKAIAFENRKVTAPLQYFTTRFPIINQSGRELMQIAFVGNASDSSADIDLTNQELSQKRTMLNEAIDQSRNQDVLFLIDGTQSMKQHFPAVLKGMQNFINSIQRDTEKNRFRFGLAIYRDYQDVHNGFHQLAKLGDDVTRFLNTETAYSVEADHDFPEALFQGIAKSVQQTGWGIGRTRAIIVIGDHGNHLSDKFTEEQVANTLESKNVAFYSINVNRNQQENFKYNKVFDRQVENILALSGGIGKSYVVEETENNNAALTEKAIEETLGNIFNFSSEVSFGFKDITEGKQLKEIEATYGTQVTTYLRRIMQEHGLTEKEINMASLSQICEDGWVSKKSKDGMVQLSPWVLIDRSGLDELVGIMSGLYKRARSRKAQGLGAAVTEIVKRASGDEINENERLSQFLYRRFHIPFREISDVLQYSPSELEEKFQSSPAFKERFIQKMGETYALLQSVQEEKSGRLVWDKDTLRWNKLDPQERRWWWKTSTGMSFAWIPMDYMP